MRQVEKDSYNGPHTVLHGLPHRDRVRVQLPAVTLDHLLTPAQRPEGGERLEELTEKHNVSTLFFSRI